MNKLSDLRFVIGIFFAIVGVFLTLYYLFSNHEGPHDVHPLINFRSGLSFLAFGLLMIFLSYKGNRKK